MQVNKDRDVAGRCPHTEMGPQSRWVCLEGPGIPKEETSSRMRTRGRWKDIPGRRNEVGKHEEDRKA